MKLEEKYIRLGKFIDLLINWGFRHYFQSEPNKIDISKATGFSIEEIEDL